MATLLIGWSHRYTMYTVVITIWLIATKYLYLKNNGSFIFYVDVSFFYHCQYYYLLLAPEFTSGFCGVRVAPRFSFFVLFCYVSLRSEFRVICVCTVHKYCVVFCFVFLRLVFPMLPISFDCPFLIAPSVLSNVYSLMQPSLFLVDIYMHLRHRYTEDTCQRFLRIKNKCRIFYCWVSSLLIHGWSRSDQSPLIKITLRFLLTRRDE